MTTTTTPARPAHKDSARRTGWRYVTPTLLVLGVITIVPTIFLYAVSLFDYDVGTSLRDADFVGLANYTRLLSGADDAFWPAVTVTVGLLLVTTVGSVGLGLLIAVLLTQRTRSSRFYVTLMLVPLVMTPVVAGLIWRLMFNNLYGVINGYLRPLGLAQNWLGDSTLAFVSVSVVEIWQWTPFVALILYAGLLALPQPPHEAALVDGANAWQMFRHITFPLLKPLFGLVIALRVIDAVKIFDTAYVLTQGGPGRATETLGLLVFHRGLYQTGRIGQASAVAVVLLIIVTIVSRYVTAYLRRAEELQG